jgi:hypothetical protein
MVGEHGWKLEMQVMYWFSLLTCFFWISFTCPVCFSVIEYSLFALSCIFTYICATFWLFCCYLRTLDGRADGCLGVVGLGKWRSGSCIVEAILGEVLTTKSAHKFSSAAKGETLEGELASKLSLVPGELHLDWKNWNLGFNWCDLGTIFKALSFYS